MKALFVNGSPRKKWTTAQMLERAMEGARDAGAEAELVHLCDIPQRGCTSCFACKLKDARTDGVCAVKDELRPLLEKAHDANVIVIGSPIYFDCTTGMTRSFMERLMFPVLSYNPKVDIDTGEMESSLLGRVVPTAMIYTMGSPKEAAEANGYPEKLGVNSHYLGMLFGPTETLCSYSAYQFKDYERYEVMDGVEQVRREYKDEQLPKDLEESYELGRRLVELARAEER